MHNMCLGEHINGISKTNVNWRNFAVRDTWETKMSKGYTKMKFNHAFCNRDLTRGGVSMICTPRFHSRYLEQGSDQELGRWMWMRFKGNDNYNLVVLMAKEEVSQKTHAISKQK